ncbi:MAG TPA: PAS domain-containing protein, partial [Vicinamibacterales bacterium]
MTDRIPPPCLEQDGDGHITAWSAAAERLFGWSASDIIGRPSHDLVPARNHERNDRSIREMAAAAEGRVLKREVTGLRRDGVEFPMHVTIVRRRTASGI